MMRSDDTARRATPTHDASWGDYPTPGPAAGRRVAVLIRGESDVMTACRQVRLLAEESGFSRAGAYQVATAASELAANVLIHAGGGLLQAGLLTTRGIEGQTAGIELIAVDEGPGIHDLALALTDGYSTGGGLGCGLPGVKRLMDALSIDSQRGVGTRVRAVKWR